MKDHLLSILAGILIGYILFSSLDGCFSNKYKKFKQWSDCPPADPISVQIDTIIILDTIEITPEPVKGKLPVPSATVTYKDTGNISYLSDSLIAGHQKLCDSIRIYDLTIDDSILLLEIRAKVKGVLADSIEYFYKIKPVPIEKEVITKTITKIKEARGVFATVAIGKTPIDQFSPDPHYPTLKIGADILINKWMIGAEKSVFDKGWEVKVGRKIF